LALCALLVPVSARPQQGPLPARDAPVTVIDAVITVDGVLDEPAWTNAPAIGDLVQRQPDPGVAPTERTRVTLLRSTPPFTDPMTETVREWKFFPARAVVNGDAARSGSQIARAAVPATVLVIGMFRPPAMNAPTLGESAKDLASGSDAVPFPASTTMPRYPPRASGSGVVLLEARVSAIGSVEDVGVIASSPAFDEAARDTIRTWHFRPAKRDWIAMWGKSSAVSE